MNPATLIDALSVVALSALAALSIFMGSRNVAPFLQAICLGLLLLIASIVVGVINFNSSFGTGLEADVSEILNVPVALIQALNIPAFILIFAAPWQWLTRNWPPHLSLRTSYGLHWAIILCWVAVVFTETENPFAAASPPLDAYPAEEALAALQSRLTDAAVHRFAFFAYYSFIVMLWLAPPIALAVTSVRKRIR